MGNAFRTGRFSEQQLAELLGRPSPNSGQAAREISTLKQFGLIVAVKNTEPSDKTSYYRLTRIGRQIAFQKEGDPAYLKALQWAFDQPPLYNSLRLPIERELPEDLLTKMVEYGITPEAASEAERILRDSARQAGLLEEPEDLSLPEEKLSQRRSLDQDRATVYASVSDSWPTQPVPPSPERSILNREAKINAADYNELATRRLDSDEDYRKYAISVFVATFPLLIVSLNEFLSPGSSFTFTQKLTHYFLTLVSAASGGVWLILTYKVRATKNKDTRALVMRRIEEQLGYFAEDENDSDKAFRLQIFPISPTHSLSEEPMNELRTKILLDLNKVFSNINPKLLKVRSTTPLGQPDVATFTMVATKDPRADLFLEGQLWKTKAGTIQLYLKVKDPKGDIKHSDHLFDLGGDAFKTEISPFLQGFAEITNEKLSVERKTSFWTILPNGFKFLSRRSRAQATS